jgi:hypothetical protein
MDNDPPQRAHHGKGVIPSARGISSCSVDRPTDGVIRSPQARNLVAHEPPWHPTRCCQCKLLHRAVRRNDTHTLTRHSESAAWVAISDNWRQIG